MVKSIRLVSFFIMQAKHGTEGNRLRQMLSNGYAGSASYMVLELTLHGGLIFFRWDICLMEYAGEGTKNRPAEYA